MNYAAFKKAFFPHLCHAVADEKEADDMDSTKGAEFNLIKERIKTNQESENAQARILKIEQILKTKFSNNYESVR